MFSVPEPDESRTPIRKPVAEWRDWWQHHADDPTEPLRTAAGQGFVLSAAQLTALGVTRSQSRHRVRTARWTDAGRGAVAPLDVRDDVDPHRSDRRRHALQSAGATLRRPHAVVTGRSAAIMRGLPTMRVPGLPELTDEADWGGSRRAAHLYVATLADAEITSWHGVPVETIGRTLVTVARHGRRDAIMAIDAALRERLIDRDGITHALDTAFGWPWVRQARAMFAFADARSESPLESITRLALHDSGFPEPDLQVWFGDDRVDFYWSKYGVVLEADGRVKYVGNASWLEKQRERRLLRHPDVRHIERVGWWDVTVGWEQTAAGLWTRFR